MSTQDAFTDRLSDYLDDEDLPPADRTEIAAHLDSCTSCQQALGGLRDVRRRAESLSSSVPDVDLWPGILRRINASPRLTQFRESRRTRITFTLPQLAAAALALMVLSGGLVWLARLGGPNTDFPPIDARTQQQPDGRPVDLTPATFADDRYDAAIADLQKTLEAGRSTLDPQTIRVLEENLTAIDRAIEQCRQALASDPANAYLNAHLAEAKKRKLTLLRRATALTNTEG